MDPQRATIGDFCREPFGVEVVGWGMEVADVANRIPLRSWTSEMEEDTEGVALRFKGLDTWEIPELLEALWSGQSRSVAACLAALARARDRRRRGDATSFRERRSVDLRGSRRFRSHRGARRARARSYVRLAAIAHGHLARGRSRPSHGLGNQAEDDAASGSAGARDSSSGKRPTWCSAYRRAVPAHSRSESCRRRSAPAR